MMMAIQLGGSEQPIIDGRDTDFRGKIDIVWVKVLFLFRMKYHLIQSKLKFVEFESLR